MLSKNELIIQYYQKIKSANKELTKKEAFKDLLNRLYFGNTEIQEIIDKITLGAEATVVNIPRKDKLHKGSADTLYNNIIIEFENDLRVTGKHATEQLAGYLLGKIRSGAGYDFTLIASDFITWKVVAPDISCIDKLDTLQEHELILNETDSSFVLSEDNTEDFYFWLDRFLFRENKQKATLKSIEDAFGNQSIIFIESFRQLNHWFNDAKKYGDIQVSHEQWHKFLSIAYGAFEKREDAFLIHTYLSVFSKMLAYSVVSNDDYIDDDEMLDILNGSIFHKYNIANFVDNDFFHWVSGERDFPKLKKVFRLIAQELSAFDFEHVNEDILKGVYQELIDLDTRHRLGEYYTPDWLCERIVNEFNFEKHNKILDPSCGSGSFLRAAVGRIRILNAGITAEEISEQIYGIDIHPLSVQIAKTTLLLALGKDVTKARKPVQLNILLANTLYSPIYEIRLFGTEFEMPIDKDKYLINSLVLDNLDEFNKALEACDKLSANSVNSQSISLADFKNIIQKQISTNLNEQVIDSYFNIYKGFKKAKEQKRDGIWKFIISNQYKPYFLRERFDYIIGNPPWFTYSSINNEDYQNVLDTLAVKYKVMPTRTANFPHLEIAAIFLAHCSSYFLKARGKLAFVLPRSFFNGDQHDQTRSGKAKGFHIAEIWDMNDVKPLFRIPSCVIFAYKKEAIKKIKQEGIAGIQFAGQLPAHNCHYDIAAKRLKEKPLTWRLARQGNSTAFSAKENSSRNRLNPYKQYFKQGATIVPRAFYFIDLNQDMPDDFHNRIIHIKTAADIQTDTKAPWKLYYNGQIESRFIFRTAIAKSILPFYLYNPAMVTLPITIETDDGKNKQIVLHTAEQLMKAGELDAWKWFANGERIWEISKTEKNGKTNSSDYLNWLNKLTGQNLNVRYLVLYNASAKDANTLVVDRNDIDLEFIVESKTYVYYTSDEFEAYYLSAILNSSIPNMLMKDFQTKGLFGPRDIHKKILDIYFPKYNREETLHTRLAELGAECHSLAKEFVSHRQFPPNLSARELGNVRLEIKKHLSANMEEIDRLVEQLLQ